MEHRSPLFPLGMGTGSSASTKPTRTVVSFPRARARPLSVACHPPLKDAVVKLSLRGGGPLGDNAETVEGGPEDEAGGSFGRGGGQVLVARKSDDNAFAHSGITGAIGQDFLRLLASERAAGKRLSFDFEVREYTVQDLAAPGAFDGVDIVLFSMVATPLHRHAKVLRMVASTYQAASGAGAAAMEELKLQTQEHDFNIFSHNAPVLVSGYNEEEMKMVKETRRIWNDKDVKVTATCIRVPVMRAHAESVNLQFENPLDEDTAREILRAAPGVTIINDPGVTIIDDRGITIINDRATNRFPALVEVSDKDDVGVGRIRQELSHDDNRGLDIFICGDQIRKGATLNAVQIAEMLLK